MEAILACTKKGGIGLNGKLPWRIKEDMMLFKKITTTTAATISQNAVIMGRKTWESIPKKFRPLPNRINIILSTTMDKNKTENSKSIYVANSLNELDLIIENLKKKDNLVTPFIIGGAKLYNKMFKLNKISKVHMSLLRDDYDCDTFFDMNYINDEIFEIIEEIPFDKFTYIQYKMKQN
jgi:dihydrofolate reductase